MYSTAAITTHFLYYTLIDTGTHNGSLLDWLKILKKIFFSLIPLSVGNIVPFGKCISDTKFYKKIFTFDPGSHSLKV